MSESEPAGSSIAKAVEIAVRLMVVGFFVVACYRIIEPFISLMVWGGVMAVVLYPLLEKVTRAMGGRRKLALILIMVLGLVLLLVPIIEITDSLVESAAALIDAIQEETLRVPPPPARVADWPVVGQKVYDIWNQASVNLQSLVETYQSQLADFSLSLLTALAGAGASLLQFVLALLVSALFMANAEATSQWFRKLADRLVGEAGSGEDFLQLSVATVRSVTTGVLGVAVIQSLLAGLGMIWADVPAAGIWAVGVLILAIMQLPPILIMLPAALWVFGTADSQLTAWGFLIYSILVSFSDMVLKPLLMGRGVDVPMPVILLGAIGGMLLQGIIGLFVGAVTLALGYRLFLAWLELAEGKGTPAPGNTEPGPVDA